MHIDHAQEWLRLTQEYRAKDDAELRELYREYADLTPVAQETLTAELRSRGLDRQMAEEQLAAERDCTAAFERADEELRKRASRDAWDEAGDDGGDEDEDARPPVYTWKTPLCDGMEFDRAWQIREVLRRAGIESWLERPGAPFVTTIRDAGMGDLRVVVAADELDRARAVIANPIPQDVIDESHLPVPEYVPPRCPSCGAEDPILESTEPVNGWKCEICGSEWSEEAGESRREARRF